MGIGKIYICWKCTVGNLATVTIGKRITLLEVVNFLAE